MLPGLRSRWTTPGWWAYSTASATLRISAGGLPRGERAVGQPLREALPVDVAHREVVLALVLADLVDRHDAGVVEVAGGLGLGVEPLDVGLAGELPGQDHLQGHEAVEAHLPGLVDDAHAAAGDLAEDLVVAEVANACRGGTRGLDRGGGSMVDRQVIARRHGRVLVDAAGRHARNRGSRRVRGRKRRRLGSRTDPGLRDRLFRSAQFALQVLELGAERGACLWRDLLDVVVDRPSCSSPELLLEAAADHVDQADHLDVQSLEIAAGSIAHRVFRSSSKVHRMLRAGTGHDRPDDELYRKMYVSPAVVTSRSRFEADPVFRTHSDSGV